MKRMIPQDKMSKKARKALAQEKRNVWTVNPVTRVRESGKAYNRKGAKTAMMDE